MDHWTGPAAIGWGLRRRFCIASSGSFTFLSFWAGLKVSKTDVITRSKFLDDLVGNIALASIVTVVLVFSVLYGILVSWNDQQYGPIRLYLSGFLFSYFIWFLLSQASYWII